MADSEARFVSSSVQSNKEAKKKIIGKHKVLHILSSVWMLQTLKIQWQMLRQDFSNLTNSTNLQH